MSVLYVDTSVVVRLLFGEPEPLAEWTGRTETWSSILLGIEVRRSIHRLRLRGDIDDSEVATLLGNAISIERTLSIISLDEPIVALASASMPVPVRTLDAVHIATALALQAERPNLLLATHDARQALAAATLGLTVIGVQA